jgi:hypothetical protein
MAAAYAIISTWLIWPKAHVAALKLMEKESFKGYDVFNIGTGKGSLGIRSDKSL